MAAMSVLSDGTIRRLVEEGRIVIDPWDPGLVQPASVDLRLGNSFRVFHNHRSAAIDLREPPTDLTEQITVKQEESFVVHPGEFVLGRTEECVSIPDDIVARIEGKALSLRTEVPTPTGWTTMGDLEVGDRVLAPDGNPVPVVAATPVLEGRECFGVRFSDGTRIVADAQHQWLVSTYQDRRRHRGGSRILTTRELRDSLKVRQEYNHHVAQTAPVRYETKSQLVDPYVLGAWLGDGTSTSGAITSTDEPILRELVQAGYDVRPTRREYLYRVAGRPMARDVRTGRFAANGSLQSQLRELGVLGNKHVPEAYVRGDVSQRRALLQGIMDTDGHVDELGRCELTTVDGRLADQYFELIAGLGHRPYLHLKTARLDGRPCGPAFLIKFTPSEPVFRLPRKLARQKLVGRFKRGRAIVDVSPVDSEPVRCIEVGSPSGTFLVTKSFIPTHNSSLGRLGLIVHATAGFVDPGFNGSLTLEITNLTRIPIKLYTGLLIAQLSFMTLDAPAERPYGSEELGSHYQGQTAATESRYMR